MVYMLWYKGKSGFQSVHSWIDKLCGTYNFYPIVIDQENAGKNDFTYASLDDVLKDKKYKDYKWVWLDSKGDQILDEYEHPKENVIYCIGSDFDGFGRDISKLKGDKVRIRQDKKEDWFAAIIVPLVIYDRYLYLKGRRK